MIYIASRVRHAPMWRGIAEQRRVSSSWIYEAEEGQTEDFGFLWKRIEAEVWNSAWLLFYAESEDFPLKGALVEVGMALAWQKPVVVCLPGVELEGRTMRPVGSWIKHPNVTVVDSFAAAMARP